MVGSPPRLPAEGDGGGGGPHTDSPLRPRRPCFSGRAGWWRTRGGQQGTGRRPPAARSGAAMQVSTGPGARGTLLPAARYLHRRHAREAQLPQRAQHPGVQRHRQRLPGPLRHVLHSEPRRRRPRNARSEHFRFRPPTGPAGNRARAAEFRGAERRPRRRGPGSGLGGEEKRAAGARQVQGRPSGVRAATGAGRLATASGRWAGGMCPSLSPPREAAGSTVPRVGRG